MLIYKFTNEVQFPTHWDPTKQYNTKVIQAKYEKGNLVIELEFLGTEFTGDCLFPVSEDVDFHTHPFVD